MEQPSARPRHYCRLERRVPGPLLRAALQKDYELMIAVRLSAACTDERVNKITPAYSPASRRWSALLSSRYLGGRGIRPLMRVL